MVGGRTGWVLATTGFSLRVAPLLQGLGRQYKEHGSFHLSRSTTEPRVEGGSLLTHVERRAVSGIVARGGRVVSRIVGRRYVGP